MNFETILELALLMGVGLLVVAVGIRVRVTQPLLLLLRRPALGLRAVFAMYVALPAFVLLLVWLLPLQASVVAVLLGFAVAPVLPPWAKNGGAVGGQDDYVIGLELLSAGVGLLLVPIFIWLVNRTFGVVTVLEPLAVEGVLLVTFVAPLAGTPYSLRVVYRGLPEALLLGPANSRAAGKVTLGLGDSPT